MDKEDIIYKLRCVFNEDYFIEDYGNSISIEDTDGSVYIDWLCDDFTEDVLIKYANGIPYDQGSSDKANEFTDDYLRLGELIIKALL